MTAIHEMLNLALQHHRDGRFDEAQIFIVKSFKSMRIIQTHFI